MLGLAVLEGDRDAANHWLGEAEIGLGEAWQAETTADSLAEIRSARAGRGEDVAWLVTIEAELRRMQRNKAGKEVA
jgi:hypothetical protein